MYYPQTVEKNMGPTCILPGTHVLKALPERMASQGNFRDQYIASVPAGSVVILHYDIWHAGTANTSNKVRYMLKFLFHRASNPSVPSWHHDSANDVAIRGRLESESPMGMQRALSAKQKHFRTRMWEPVGGEMNRWICRIGTSGLVVLGIRCYSQVSKELIVICLL